MKWLGAICVALSMSAICLADPPTLDIQPEIVASGQYVSFAPKTDAKSVIYIGLSGVEPFPTEMLKDGRSFLLPVGGLKTGYYKFIAIAVKDNEITRKDFKIKVGEAKPDIIPDPDKPVDPVIPVDPKLDNAPVSTNGLYVAFINESGNRVTQQQFNVMYGATVGKWLDANAPKNWRIIDQNNIALTEPWKNILVRKRGNLPWIVIISGKKYVYEGALPTDVTAESLIKLFSSYKIVEAKPVGYRSIEADRARNTGVVVSDIKNNVTPEVVTRNPFSQEAIGLTTIVLTVDDWKQQYQDTQVEELTTIIVAPIKTVKTLEAFVPFGNTNSCINGNCAMPQYPNRWYPGRLLGR